MGINRYLLIPLIICLYTTTGLAAEPRLRPAEWATPVVSDQFYNWYQVDPLVYRSEQPDEEGMAELERMGIKRVLNLREFHSDDDEAEGTGLQLSCVAMNAASIKDEDIVEALAIIAASDEPILVHCWHGSDRTGTVVAMYRMVFYDWSAEQALDELINGGYGYHAIYGNIARYIRQVDIDKIRTALNMDRRNR